MRKRISLAIGAALLTWAAAAQTLFVSGSWIDGELKTDRYYIMREIDSEPVHPYYPVDAGKKLLLKADIPVGHEVTKWSYGTSFDQTAVAKGHLEKVKVTSDVTYEWTGTSDDKAYLAVHLDWLKYTINFNANGGRGTMAAEEDRVYNQTYTLPANGFTRVGYTFQGWALTPTGSVVTSVGGSDFAALDYKNKSVTLYAIWKVNTYTVIFNANGGLFEDETTEKELAETYGAAYTFPPAPTRGGYTFEDAWTNAVGQEIKSDSTVAITSAQTFYAKWKALPAMTVETVKYADEEGANGSSAPGRASYQWGETAHLQATPSTGSRFVGWSKAVETGAIVSTSENYDIVVTEAVTYYAHFALEEYKVTFKYKDANGSDVVSSQMVKYNQNAEPPSTPDWGRNKFKAWSSDKYLSVKGECIIEAIYSEHATVSFDSNDGRSLTFTPIDVIFGEAYGSLPIMPSREMYEFLGWKSPEAEIVTKSSIVAVHGDHTLVAAWKTEPFWLTLSANGGSVQPGQVQVTYDSAYPALPQPIREGYEFLGWFTAQEGGEEVRAGDRVQVKRNAYLYAHWKAEEWTVTFDPAGGSVAETSRVVVYNTQYGKLPEPARTGYTFNGWFAPDETRVYESTTFRGRADQTLTAKWSANTYRVSFDGNGSTGGYMSSQTFTYDTAAALTDNAYTRTGYAFLGWSTSSSAETPDYANQETVKNLLTTGSLTFYAVWKANSYTIAFDKNGGLGEMSSIAATYDVDVTLPPCTMTWGSNSFKGWLLGGKTYPDGATVRNLTGTANETVTLVAQWSDDYVIVFHGHGETSGEMARQAIAVSSYAYLCPNAYARTGYTFAGWATSETDAAEKKSAYSDGARVKGLGTSGSTIDLFAVWTNNVYTVRCHPNGGAGQVVEQELTYDVEAMLTPYTRNGFDFAGWALDPTEGETLAKILNLTTTGGDVVDLYARWSRPTIDSDLSKAADCDQDGDDRIALELPDTEGCTVVDLEDCGGNNKCIRIHQPVIVSSGIPDASAKLSVAVRTSGTLTFNYKTFCNQDHPQGECRARFYVGNEEKLSKDVTVGAEEWETFTCDITVDVSGEPVELIWQLIGYNEETDESDSFYIDNIRWQPKTGSSAEDVGITFRGREGAVVTNMTCKIGAAIGPLPIPVGEGFLGWGLTPDATAYIDATWTVPSVDTQLYAVWAAAEHPVPTEKDRPVIGAGFSFVTDENFDYVILTTPSLVAPIAWTEGPVLPGDGQPVVIPVKDDAAAGTGCRFYKVEVRQRK